MTAASTPFIVGWQEWLALPELGLPAIKAKIDTGARTSALHAFHIEPFGPAAAPMVRFGVHPVPGRLDIAIFCSATIVDRREVTSSNGERDNRFFIRTPVALGGRSWPIEIGLTNREGMSYRMLLGRQAIRDDMMIDPTASYRQRRLSYRLYRQLPQLEPVRRALRIAMLHGSGKPLASRRLDQAAQARGHVLEALDLERLVLTFDTELPGLLLDGEALAHYDAVLPRIGLADGARGAAAVRQLEMMGSVSLNPAAALDLRANRLATIQALYRAHVAHAIPWNAGPWNAGSRDDIAVPPPASFLRVLVAGDSAIAVLLRQSDRSLHAGPKRHRSVRRLAEHAAKAVGLGLAAVDIDAGSERPRVLRISARPALAHVERVSRVDVATKVMAAIEACAGVALDAHSRRRMGEDLLVDF